MASKSIFLLLIVTFAVQTLGALLACPNTRFIEKHVYKGNYNRQTLQELEDFADKRAHDRIKPVSRQTVYIISDNSEKLARNWSNDRGICKWNTAKTKYVFSRKWTCLLKGTGFAIHPSKPKEPCPKPDFKFICKNCNSKDDVELYANEMAEKSTPVASNHVYNIKDSATWVRNPVMETCKLTNPAQYYQCYNGWHRLEGPVTGNGDHRATDGHLVDN